MDNDLQLHLSDTLLAMDLKIHGLQNTWITNLDFDCHYYGSGLENTRTKNLDYNYYSLWYLDFKAIGLWIWISIVIYVTELELENT